MKKILLIMRRKLIAEAIVKEMGRNGKFMLLVEYNYQNMKTTFDVFNPDLVLLEIPESTEINKPAWIDLCEYIKRKNFNQKILLLCPEDNIKACKVTEEMIQTDLADDFVYYDTSMRYLVSKLEAL